MAKGRRNRRPQSHRHAHRLVRPGVLGDQNGDQQGGDDAFERTLKQVISMPEQVRTLTVLRTVQKITEAISDIEDVMEPIEAPDAPEWVTDDWSAWLERVAESPKSTASMAIAAAALMALAERLAEDAA